MSHPEFVAWVENLLADQPPSYHESGMSTLRLAAERLWKKAEEARAQKQVDQVPWVRACSRHVVGHVCGRGFVKAGMCLGIRSRAHLGTCLCRCSHRPLAQV